MKKFKVITMNISLFGTLLLILTSCQSKQQEANQVSTIDSILQVKATSILESKLSQSYISNLII